MQEAPLAAAIDMRSQSHRSDFCAIVGMALKFPGQPGTAGFWATAVSRSDVQIEVPHSRWNVDEAYSPDIRPGRLLPSTRYAPVKSAISHTKASIIRR